LHEEKRAFQQGNAEKHIEHKFVGEGSQKINISVTYHVQEIANGP